MSLERVTSGIVQRLKFGLFENGDIIGWAMSDRIDRTLVGDAPSPA
jgi:hypothetical protein